MTEETARLKDLLLVSEVFSVEVSLDSDVVFVTELEIAVEAVVLTDDLPIQSPNQVLDLVLELVLVDMEVTEEAPSWILQPQILLLFHPYHSPLRPSCLCVFVIFECLMSFLRLPHLLVFLENKGHLLAVMLVTLERLQCLLQYVFLHLFSIF
jgi:hypothetical protein